MATHQSKAQQETVARVMHAFKHGDLERRDGEPVKDPRQAIAIALREAGASDQETPAQNRAALRRTKARERGGATARARKAGDAAGPTRAALYAEAKKRGIAGRSRMSKGELARALRG